MKYLSYFLKIAISFTHSNHIQKTQFIFIQKLTQLQQQISS